MKTIQAILILTALCAVASAQSNSTPAAEQRFFNLEDAVQSPVRLSDAELAALAGDDLMRRELHQDSPGAKLTQDGLEAAVVALCDAQERDLVVIGNGAAFVSANAGPFWIIRDLPSGPVVVLSEVSLGLTIQAKRSKRCLNIETFAATATESTTTDFSFNGEKYIVSRQKSAKLGG
jgi:hypothetical protein